MGGAKGARNGNAPRAPALAPICLPFNLGKKLPICHALMVLPTLALAPTPAFPRC